MDHSKYFRRRQFVLGPGPAACGGWLQRRIGRGHVLTTHPDLPVHQAEAEGRSLTLLGYMVDPFAPGEDEAAILHHLLERSKALPDLIAELERQSGRFALLAMFGPAAWLFHDAAGLRQVLYGRDQQGRTWCASQAEALADQLGFEVDPSIAEYAASPVFRGPRSEFWLPNDRTPYREVRQLLPNHYLDLGSGEAHRFWPAAGSVPRRSIEEAISQAIPILKNSLAGLSRRHELKMGITAGMDSRKTLAASRGLLDRISFFTIEHAKPGPSVDVRIPGRLLPPLGLNRQVFPERDMDDEFRRLYRASATMARESKGRVAYTLYAHIGPEETILGSNASEITQCNYWLPRKYITGEGLAIITGLYHPLAIDEFGRWLGAARGACNGSGLSVLTLFHWEQRVGRWAAASFGEYDIVHESFTPYANRLLNALLLGISERYRRDRMGLVGRRLIKAMWPELLAEPINPGEDLLSGLKVFVRREIFHRFITPRVPLFEFLKFQKKKRQAKSR